MSELPPELEGELSRVWAALSQDLAIPVPTFLIERGSLRASLRKELFVVPSAYVDHFKRFGNVPSALVRDAAYEAKRRQLSQRATHAGHAEADALTYAEAFLRATLLQDPE